MRAEIRFLRVVDRRFNAIKIWRHQSRQTDTDGGRSHHLGCGKRERERKASLQIRRFLVGERRERAFARRSQTGIEAEGFIIQRVSASCILPLCWIRGSWRVWSNHPWAVPPPPPLPPLPNAPPRFLFSTILRYSPRYRPDPAFQSYIRHWFAANDWHSFRNVVWHDVFMYTFVSFQQRNLELLELRKD